MTDESQSQMEFFNPGVDLEGQKLLAGFIYIDTSVYRSEQFDWNGTALSGIRDLARQHLLRVVITPITRKEVLARMRVEWAEANKKVKDSRILLGQVGLPNAAEILADEEKCLASMKAHFDMWLGDCLVEICETAADMDAVMEDYFNEKPPFIGGKKKAEFPDAMVISSLRQWCLENDTRLYVVSNDGDIRHCCSKEGKLIETKSIGEVISHGKVTARIYEAINLAVSNSKYIEDTLRNGIPAIEVNVFIPSWSSRQISADADQVRLEEYIIKDVVIDETTALGARCAVHIGAQLSMRVNSEIAPEQIAEDEWDSGYDGAQRMTFVCGVTVIVLARVETDQKIRLFDAFLWDEKLEIDWQDVKSQLD